MGYGSDKLTAIAFDLFPVFDVLLKLRIGGGQITHIPVKLP